MRAGSPNIPLLLVVQWSDVFRAEDYELERAEAPPSGSEPVFTSVGIFTGEDRRPNGKIAYVDDAGFARAGGDCFRVRATAGSEVSAWAEKCVPVPPSSGGPPPSADFGFSVEFTQDYELTVISWQAKIGAYGPFTLTRQGTFVPIATVPILGGALPVRLVFPSMNGCFRLEAAGAPPVESACFPFPTDLPGPTLPGRLRPNFSAVSVQRTGRSEAPIAVLWQASGGPTDLLFRISRKIDVVYFEAVSLSYPGARLPGDPENRLVFLDPTPFRGDELCYRIDAVSSVGESLIGEACLGDAAPGPPDAGSGIEGDPPARWPRASLVGMVLVLFTVTWVVNRRRASLRSRC